jgi:hypothetical protein
MERCKESGKCSLTECRLHFHGSRRIIVSSRLTFHVDPSGNYFTWSDSTKTFHSGLYATSFDGCTEYAAR